MPAPPTRPNSSFHSQTFDPGRCSDEARRGSQTGFGMASACSVSPLCRGTGRPSRGDGTGWWPGMSECRLATPPTQSDT